MWRCFYGGAHHYMLVSIDTYCRWCFPPDTNLRDLHAHGETFSRIYPDYPPHADCFSEQAGVGL